MKESILDHHLKRRPGGLATAVGRFYGLPIFVIALYLVLLAYDQYYYWQLGSNDHPKQLNPSYLIRAKHGAVASENQRCSVIGVDAMKDGGNAVDAAIAATFCLGVVNMFSCVA